MKVSTIVQHLYTNPPLVHGRGEHCWKISKCCVQFLCDTVQPGAVTLETGCGLSTIIFALQAARHTCVVPDENEVDRLNEYCKQQQISLANVTFEIAASQHFLPRYNAGPLDLVLIDGCHSFPSPFIDWYYSEPHLVVGGRMVIDDVHLWTGDILQQFLKEDPRWKLVATLPPRTVVFRKEAGGSCDVAWDEQPFVRSRSRTSRLSQGLQHAGYLLRGMLSRNDSSMPLTTSADRSQPMS